ncbi:hypothetical protein UCREL1_5579 [Eutypa lata UCREL1]|uniref:Uncharacterized protein n=1 Tax=Eutypa lata (strain UCR-EL1) TaxID=1287681 RepID=M7ST16_EUTLA|nr:hypothetical protein UCREL1_5579 [Eutypa lata UCREL1]
MVGLEVPAGVTLAGFIMTVFGWYGMVRYGIEMVYKDYQTVKKTDIEISDALLDMEKHNKVMESWRKMWMISEDTPQSLYKLYWGNDYGSGHEIQKRLDRLRDMIANAGEEFERFAVLTKESWEKLKDRKKKKLWKDLKERLTKKLKKAQYVGVKKTHLHHLVDDIASKISAVQEAARHSWLLERGIYDLRREVKPDDIRHVAFSHLLVPLAVKVWPIMDDPKTWLGEGKFRTDLELDIFGDSAHGHTGIPR